MRTDLHAAGAVDAAALAGVLELLVSERGVTLPAAWVAAARWVDRDVVHASALDAPAGKLLASHHAARPLSSDEALALWNVTLPEGARMKHVEPLGPVTRERLATLLTTQARLHARFGEGRVTVLAMGPEALPARAVLSRGNALEYVALGRDWKAAPGQRWLVDAAREARSARQAPARLGILGTSITHSRSPRIHRQPFDRIDLAEDAPVEALVDALLPHYRGFAVTSPFKLRLARHTRSPLDAINTLVRRGDHWESFNTDIEGARAVLERLGAARALRARRRWRERRLARRGRRVRPSPALPAPRARSPSPSRAWACGRGRIASRPPRPCASRARAWPSSPTGLRRAASPPTSPAAGARPLLLGAAWFIAQARQQRDLWETAT